MHKDCNRSPFCAFSGYLTHYPIRRFRIELLQKLPVSVQALRMGSSGKIPFSDQGSFCQLKAWRGAKRISREAKGWTVTRRRFSTGGGCWLLEACYGCAAPWRRPNSCSGSERCPFVRRLLRPSNTLSSPLIMGKYEEWRLRCPMRSWARWSNIWGFHTHWPQLESGGSSHRSHRCPGRASGMLLSFLRCVLSSWRIAFCWTTCSLSGSLPTWIQW